MATNITSFQGKSLDDSPTDTSHLDMDCMAQVRDVINRVGLTWPSGTIKILEKRNPALLAKLNSIEGRLDSLILIVQKPQQLKDEFKKTLAEYEHCISLCAEYAKRHVAE